VQGLVQSTSVAEQNLLADASRIAERCGKTCKGKAECHRAVADGLRALGYDATVCKSRWEMTPSYPAGIYSFSPRLTSPRLSHVSGSPRCVCAGVPARSWGGGGAAGRFRR
jgi:hypothetical protein